jgi:ketosteroid isomerase-like protein
MAGTDRGRVLWRALDASVHGDVEALPDLFTDDVSGWSPNLLVTTREELAEAVAVREETLSDVTIEIDALDVFGNKGFAEYRLTGVFSDPLVLDDDVVVDPHGRTIHMGGAIVAEFAGDKISAFRNYFDDVSLLEQMVAA